MEVSKRQLRGEALLHRSFASRERLLRFLHRQLVWLLLGVFVVVAGIHNPLVFNSQNLLLILVAASFLACLVLAQSIVLISGNFDLSTEANMVFCSVLGAVMVLPPVEITGYAGEFVQGGGHGLPPLVSIGVMLGAGVLIGLVNGLLVVRLGMNAFMVTLGMSILLLGLVLVVGVSRRLVGIPDGFRYIGSARPHGVPVSVVFVFGVFAIAHVLLAHTRLGLHLYAVGGDRRAARAAGVNVNRVQLSAFILSGFLSGLAGFLLVGRLGAASASMSTGALFLSVAAAVIGGVSLYGGRGTVPGMVGGLLLISAISNAMNLEEIPSDYVNVVTGIVIISAIGLDALGTRRKRAQEV